MSGLSQTSSVTVVIPTYRHAQFIAQTLDSVLSQTRPPAHIIVINDGSPDNTNEVVTPYLPHIQYIVQSNHGLVFTANKGLSLTKTPYVVVLASDDWLDPNALAVMQEILDTHPKVSIVHANRIKFTEDGKFDDTAKIPNAGEYNPLPQLIYRDFIFAPATMIRMQSIENKVIPNFPYCEDWAFFIHIALGGSPFFGVSASLGYYRRHNGNVTHRRFAKEILEDEIAMLSRLHKEFALSELLNDATQKSIGLRRLSLAWLYLQSGNRLYARTLFKQAWKDGQRNWNTLMGWGVCRTPSVYSYASQIRRRFTTTR